MSRENWAEITDLRVALERLSRMQRNAIVLHHYLGFSIEETAQVMGCRESSVVTHLRRGRERLERMLEIRGYQMNGDYHRARSFIESAGPARPEVIERLHRLAEARRRRRAFPILAFSAVIAAALVLVAVLLIRAWGTPSGSLSIAGGNPMATPSPTSSGHPRCADDRLSVNTPDHWVGAGMHMFTNQLTVRNTGTDTCELRGYPSIRIVLASGRPIEIEVVDRTSVLFGRDIPSRTVTLAPGQAAQFFVEWSDLPPATSTSPSCTSSPATVEVTLPGGQRAFSLHGTGIVPCAHSRLWVSPIMPGTALPGSQPATAAAVTGHHCTPILFGVSIGKAQVAQQGNRLSGAGGWTVILHLRNKTSYLASYTRDHVGHYVAVLLRGRVAATFRISRPITNGEVRVLGLSRERASALAREKDRLLLVDSGHRVLPIGQRPNPGDCS